MYDRCKIHITSGKGGYGCISYRSLGHKKGRPNGGDGGRGGNIYLQANENYHDLYHLKRNYQGNSGLKGGSEFKTGRNGKNITIYVPVGTVVSYRNQIKELNHHKQTHLILRGVRGGIGNGSLVSQDCHKPSYTIPPAAPTQLKIQLQLKLIGDIGFIGPPNVGKSSLINTLCRSKYKTGDYNFTTLYAQKGRWFTKTIVDLPGLIHRASQGRGLGAKFLQHVERVPKLYLVVSALHPLEQVQMILNELSVQNIKKIYCIIINKSDLLKNHILSYYRKQLKTIYKLPVLLLSVKYKQGFNQLHSLTFK